MKRKSRKEIEESLEKRKRAKRIKGFDKSEAWASQLPRMGSNANAPDPEDMNEERAEWAGACLDEMQIQTGTDPEDALLDLLTDLMHWADRYSEIGFDAELERAKRNYAEETYEEYEEDAQD